MKIRHQLMLSFACLIVLIVATGYYALRQNRAVNNKLRFMLTGSMQEIVCTARLDVVLHEAYGHLKALLEEKVQSEFTDSGEDKPDNGTARTIDGLHNSMTAAKRLMEEIRSATERSIALADEMGDEDLESDERQEIEAWYKEVVDLLTQFDSHQKNVVALINNRDYAAAADLLDNEMEALFEKQMLGMMKTSFNDALAEMDRDAADVLVKSDHIHALLKSTLSLLILVATGISFYLSSKLATPLSRLSRAAVRIRDGQAVPRFISSDSFEMEKLTAIFFDMVEKGETQRSELESARKRLKNHNRFLEMAIDQRTADLTRLNKNLKRQVAVREATEQKLRGLLEEKETLLKEIHHRVKNNLQIIISLLQLQSQKVDPSGKSNFLKESELRIRSMAMVHEKIYQSANLSEIDLGDYVESLSNDLFNTYGARGVNLKLTVERCPVLIDKAIPCGLMLNELVTNVFKHAFGPGKGGDLGIRLTRSAPGELQLTVADNGIGLPSEADWSRSESLGLQLVQTLAQQLDADVAVDSRDGTCFVITIPTET